MTERDVMSRRTRRDRASSGQGRNRHIFLRGKAIFPVFSQCEMFSPGRKFPFWYTQNKFPSFSEVKSKKKKKKKKKGGPHLFLKLFLLPYPSFHLPFYNFPSFLLNNFHPFSLFSRYVSKNFLVRSLWGALCPLPVTPLVVATRKKKKKANSLYTDNSILQVVQFGFPMNT